MTSDSSAKSSNTAQILNALGPFFGLILVIGLFSLSPEVRPYFLTGSNFKIIFTQTVIVAIGALGMKVESTPAEDRAEGSAELAAPSIASRWGPGRQVQLAVTTRLLRGRPARSGGRIP